MRVNPARWVVALTALLALTDGSHAADAPKAPEAALLDIRVDELEAAYKKHTDKALDVKNDLEVRVAINQWLAANKRGQYTGFWRGEEAGDGAGHTIYSAVTIKPAATVDVKLDDLKAVFKKQFNKEFDGQKSHDVSRAVNRWLVANNRSEYAGFWNGTEGKNGYGIELARPDSMIDVKLEDLQSVYKQDFKKALDVHNAQQLSLAINRWLSKTKHGDHVGFWNGEIKDESGGDEAYRIALLKYAHPAVGVEEKRQADKRLIIIAPQQFHKALEEYVEYKQKLLPTELVALEDIVKHTKGADDPDRIKRYLYTAWQKRGLGYVLLVGDRDVMPIRYMVLDRVTPAAFDYAFYPTDLYYSDLARQNGSFDDWNAKKEGFHGEYYGEVHGEKNKKDPINFDEIDYRPDVAVGRWPVSTADEVKVVAAKSVTYETAIRSEKHPALRQADAFQTAGYIDARERYDGMLEKLPHGWKSERYFFRNDNPKYKTEAPNEKNLLDSMNKGAGLILHCGHGSEETWVDCFSVNLIKKIKNADRLPVMISAGCSTAYFAPLPPYEAYTDIKGEEHKGTNAGEVFKSPPPPPNPYQKHKQVTGLGEQLLKRGPDGAVVYVGCNTGSQPCAVSLVEGFMLALSKAENPRVGDCWAGAVAYYYDHEHLADLKPNDDWYPPSIFFQGMKFMFFGDPTLPMARPEKR